MDSYKERRLRRYNVHVDMLLIYLRGMEKWPNCFGRAIIDDIPEDAKIVNVFNDLDRRCLGIHVFHQSFDIVPDGEEIPSPMHGYATVRIGWIVRRPDGSYGATNCKEEAFSQLAELQKPH